MNKPQDMNTGIQPLDAVMQEYGLKNHDLVTAVQPGFINHKQIQKARKGRRLTPRMQEKVVEALNAAIAPEEKPFEELFNYRGKKSLREE
jgi:hypothetical protein